jgi:dTDP-4-amino-4,6-dideoxygalactose transaminase
VIAEKLLNEGIDVNMVHLRNDIYTIFGGRRLDLPNMNYIEDQYLYLPINNKISDTEVNTVVETFNRINSEFL